MRSNMAGPAHSSVPKPKETEGKIGEGQKPTSNIINISTNRLANFYVFLGKKYLQDFEDIEFHAVGNAISMGVVAAENLTRNGYAEFSKVNTSTVAVTSRNGGSLSKAKLIVTLRRAPTFHEQIKKFNELREQNQANQTTNKE